MKVFLFIMNIVFWILLLYYLILTIAGLIYRFKTKNRVKLRPEEYPDIDIFIPCHNEGVVIQDTLNAMAKIRYEGILNIYVLNDNSTDDTGEIAQLFDETYSFIHHIEVPEPKEGEPRGKSRVLNYALSISNGEYFVVYDADNQPNSDAVSRLIEITKRTDRAVGAVGTVRTINSDFNLLTRFISIEFQAFQLSMQSGRVYLHKAGSLPGTNMLLKRTILEEVGGYDPKALAEDAELTIRLASKGYLIAVDPYSQTWEQEPQDLKTLVKQRTRWLQGNIYVMLKFFKEPTWWTPLCFAHLFYYKATYLLFAVLLILSNSIFVLGLFGVIEIESILPYTTLMCFSYFIYTMKLVCAVWFDKTLSFKTIIAISLMYFSYAQLFVYLLLRSFIMVYKDKRNGTVTWDKTARNKV